MWKSNAPTNSFCKDGSNKCVSPVYPACQDRTIQCLTELPLHSTMQRTNLSSNFSETPTSLGALFSYTCIEEGYLIDTLGYPEEVFVECIEPENYSNWTYNIWKNGVWENRDKTLNGCFDPNRCYSNAPSVPIDGTVTTNYTIDVQNVKIYTILEYSCANEC
jgi:hypothetical protein